MGGKHDRIFRFILFLLLQNRFVAMKKCRCSMLSELANALGPLLHVLETHH